jgi:hypothetical protein
MRYGFPSDRRQKRSRWGPPDQRTIIPNVACILPPDLTPDILHAFLLRFQLEEVEYKFSNLEAECPNVNFAENPFSESKFSAPPDVRARDQLCQERRQVLASIDRMYPIFRPPLSLGISLKKCVRKLILPSEKAIGDVVGIRGQTVKGIEKDFNVKLSFRGSSVIYDPDRPTEEQPHILIIGTKEADVERCYKKLKQMIEVGEEETLAVVDQEFQLLRFDPTEEVYPWATGETELVEKQSDREVDNAVQNLMKELSLGGREAADGETEGQRWLWERFESVDLSVRDISVVITEPAPPGT